MLLTSSLSKCSRITKKNQFIERIVGEALKRIRGSKDFNPYLKYSIKLDAVAD